MTSKHKLLETLYKENYNAMMQTALRATGDYHLAQDLVQEAFLTATLKIDKVMEHHQPKFWLYKTLHYILLRENGRAYHTREAELIENVHADKDTLSDNLEYILPKELAYKERELLILRFEKEWSYEQIAEYKGISQTACRKKMSRAVNHCKNLFEKLNSMSQNPSLTGYKEQEVVR